MSPIACVVLPVYNEADNLRLLLPRIFDQQERIATHELHALVVDDNSPDGTAAVVEEHRQRFPRLHLLRGERRGLGCAYQRGMAHALATLHPSLILEMDADLQHDPDLIPSFIAGTQEGYTVQIGSRYVPGGATPDFPWHRRTVSRVGNWLARMGGGLGPIRDITSGYRCIDAALLARCDLRHLATRGYAFQTSLLSELVHHGARVVEIPIVFPDRIHGQSKLSSRDYVEFLVMLVKLTLRHRASHRSVSSPLRSQAKPVAKAPI